MSNTNEVLSNVFLKISSANIERSGEGTCFGDPGEVLFLLDQRIVVAVSASGKTACEWVRATRVSTCCG